MGIEFDCIHRGSAEPFGVLRVLARLLRIDLASSEDRGFGARELRPSMGGRERARPVSDSLLDVAEIVDPGRQPPGQARRAARSPRHPAEGLELNKGTDLEVRGEEVEILQRIELARVIQEVLIALQETNKRGQGSAAGAFDDSKASNFVENCAS